MPDIALPDRDHSLPPLSGFTAPSGAFFMLEGNPHMLIYSDAASVAGCPAAPVTPELQQLLTRRVAAWAGEDLLDQTHVLIIQAGDMAGQVRREIGCSLLINPLGGTRFGSPAFEPHWEWLKAHPGWFEMIITVGNEGFAYFLFIQDAEGVDPYLRALCHAYAE